MGNKDNYLKVLKEDVDDIISEKLPWEKFKNKNILITGANGFIAAYMVNVLIELNNKFDYNIKVYGLVRNIEKANARYEHLLGRTDLEFIVQDVSEPIDCKADYIIHAASPANSRDIAKSKIDVINANIIGTSNVMKLAEKNKAKVLLVSSGMVYGNIELDRPIKEEDTEDVELNIYKASNLYSVSKSVSEVLCNAYRDEKGLDVKIARLFSVYGPGDDFTSGRCFNDFVMDAVNGRPITINGTGEQVRNICYVSDAVRAMYYVILKGINSEYNIGSENNISYISLAKEFNENIIIKNENKSSTIIVQDVFVPDIDKVKELKFTSQISIKQCKKKIVDSISNKGE